MCPRGGQDGFLRFSVLVAAALAMVVMFQGCAGNRQLDSFQVSRVIQNSEKFRGFKVFSFSRVADADCNKALVLSEKWRQLHNLGVIEVSQRRPWTERGRTEGCEASLVEEARKEAEAWGGDRLGQPWPALGSAPGESDEEARIPIASRHLVAVSTMRTAGGETVEVDFTWQWQPNKIGQKLGVDMQAQTSSATLWFDGDRWQVVNIKMSE